MYLREFAEQRGQNPATISQYIRDHAAEFEGHTSMDGKQKVLDEVAIQLLDKKYPLPKPIQVIEDTESRKQLVEAQQYIIKLQEKMFEMQEANNKLALEANKIKFLEADIERRDDLLDDAEQKLQEEKAQHAATQQQLSSVESELTSAKQEIERLKNRSIFDFLFKK